MTEPSPPIPSNHAVTGASGFVGQHLLSRLLSAGHTPIALSRRGTGQRDVRDIVLPSYVDADVVAKHLRGVDCVVHLAARAHQPSSRSAAAPLFREANVETTAVVARACLSAGVKRFVLVSSIGVHGSRTEGHAFTEADAPAPAEPYAVSKLEAERNVAQWLDGSRTELVVLRPPLVYGPGAPGNFARLLALVRRLPWVPLGGLHRLRSLIHIDNLCSAIELALWHPQAAGRTFVLCDGEDLSVADIARELAAGLGRPPRCVVDVPEVALRLAATVLGRGDAMAKLADELRVDASAFRSATGWVPPRGTRAALRATAAASIGHSLGKSAHA